MKVDTSLADLRGDDIRGIARAVLGHAYPDKTLDELTDKEIAVVADCIHFADETLAAVMPIVAEGRS